MPKVLVIGGGLSGLSVAHFLKKKAAQTGLLGLEVTVAEKSSRWGGWLHSERQSGYLLEHGPRGLRYSGGLDTLGLVDELGLVEEVAYAQPSSRKRFVWPIVGNTPRTVPGGYLGLGLSAGLKDLFAARGNVDQDESIYDFCVRRFGKPATEQLMDAMVAGIYAGDIKKLSIRSCFPSMQEAERRSRSVILDHWRHRGQGPQQKQKQQQAGAGTAEGDWREKVPESLRPHADQLVNRFRTEPEPVDPQRELLASPFAKAAAESGTYSFAEGVQTLPNALARSLQSSSGGSSSATRVEMLQGATVDWVDFSSAGSHLSVGMSGGGGSGKSVHRYDQVFSTLPAGPLAGLLEAEVAMALTSPRPGSAASRFDPTRYAGLRDRVQRGDLAAQLRDITYAAVWVVNLAWKHRKLPQELVGFGLLLPSAVDRDVLGITYDSYTFPRQNRWGMLHETRLTVMMGGDRNPELASISQEKAAEMAIEAVRTRLGIADPPEVVCAQLANGIPQYYVGYQERYGSLREQIRQLSNERFSVLGPVTGGVSINDCVSGAKAAAEAWCNKYVVDLAMKGAKDPFRF